MPEDGDISGLTSVTVTSTDDDNIHEVLTEDKDPYDAHLAKTFVPISGCQRTEQETIRHSVQERQNEHLPTVPPIQSCGLQQIQLRSMSSTPKGTYLVPFQHCFQLELLIF